MIHLYYNLTLYNWIIKIYLSEKAAQPGPIARINLMTVDPRLRGFFNVSKADTTSAETLKILELAAIVERTKQRFEILL